MKKTVLIICALVLTIGLYGCGKKKTADELMQEGVSMDALTAMNAEVASAHQMPAQVEKGAANVPSTVSEPKLETLPPAGPYKPTGNEIQTALQNAGFYTGQIDGKIGPKTKKAIEEFQKANNISADGKVGPKTWALLGKYLNPVPQAEGKQKR